LKLAGLRLVFSLRELTGFFTKVQNVTKKVIQKRVGQQRKAAFYTKWNNLPINKLIHED